MNEVEMSKETKLVEPIEYTGKFKKGDKVTYVREAFEWSPLLIRREGIVSSVSEHGEETPYRVVFKCHHDDSIEFFNEVELEHGWLYEVGDRVRSRNKHLYNKEEGVVISIDEDYASPMYTVSFGGTQELPFRGYNLERIVEGEKSAEQEAFEYLLSRDKDTTRRILQEEVATWAKVHLEHKDYNDLRRTIEILEKLEEESK